MLRQQMLFRYSNAVFMNDPGVDLIGWQQSVAEGVGAVLQLEKGLVYTRRTINGIVQTCGNRANFGTLLPTKAAQRTAALQLYPNPATASATLNLPEPARSRFTIRLLDNVGRVVQEQQVATGQTTAMVPLQGLALGVYTVQVQAAGEVTQHLRLQHQ
jgi:hypothetical protein